MRGQGSKGAGGLGSRDEGLLIHSQTRLLANSPPLRIMLSVSQSHSLQGAGVSPAESVTGFVTDLQT